MKRLKLSWPQRSEALERPSIEECVWRISPSLLSNCDGCPFLSLLCRTLLDAMETLGTYLTIFKEFFWNLTPDLCRSCNLHNSALEHHQLSRKHYSWRWSSTCVWFWLLVTRIQCQNSLLLDNFTTGQNIMSQAITKNDSKRPVNCLRISSTSCQ